MISQESWYVAKKKLIYQLLYLVFKNLVSFVEARNLAPFRSCVSETDTKMINQDLSGPGKLANYLQN